MNEKSEKLIDEAIDATPPEEMWELAAYFTMRVFVKLRNRDELLSIYSMLVEELEDTLEEEWDEEAGSVGPLPQ